MFERGILQNLNDYFEGKSRRGGEKVYFYRISGCSEAVLTFLSKYYEEARRTGVVLEGKIPNPDEKNLAYYEEIMGMEFQMHTGFMEMSLRKWLPRLSDIQRKHLVFAIYDTLDAMRKEGKNENMLKNAWIKFMCWLYYRFERVVGRLGGEEIPKVLYEGDISNYELKLLAVLAKAGCDVVLLQYHGDQNYQRLDPGSAISLPFEMAGLAAFPEDFSINKLRQELEKQVRTAQLYGRSPQIQNCTNAWIEGSGLADIKKSAGERGSDPKLFYNCFCRISGVEDKLTYANELYQFGLELKNGRRRMVIVEQKIAPPTVEEIAAVPRKNYQNTEQMILDLAGNAKYSVNNELQILFHKAFIDIMAEEEKRSGANLNRLTNRAVYLLCWLKRYQTQLFAGWKMPEIGVFIYLGGCQNENEALFLRMLARLPVDVLILTPNQNVSCCLQDPLLYEIHYAESLNLERFPRENAQVRMGTAAYHAERELDNLMYRDSGMYRSQQYQKAAAVNLQTMYEEIVILWDQELKYRPNFSVVNEVVNLPVIFAKVSGIKEGNVRQYWMNIKSLMTEDTFVIKRAPYLDRTRPNPVRTYAAEFFKNGKLQRAKIKSHSCYQYGVLREEMQEYILDKLQLLIEQRTIKGTFENGTEYTIIATVLNLEKELIRMIQSFDFTKKNPKLIYIHTSEAVISLEDSILTAFLNLIGFDILFFVPTGYQSVERFFNRPMMEEHQIGGYVYDLQTPDFGTVSSNTRPTWRDKIFKRGGWNGT